MPHCLIVEAAPTFGGSMTSIELVVRHGLAAGFRFGLMSRLNLNGFLPEAVTLHPLHVNERRMCSRLSLLEHYAHQSAQTLVTILRFGYDAVVLNNLFNENLPAAIAAKSLGLPVLQIVRDYERDSRLWRSLHPLVDCFVAVSESVRQHLLAQGAEPTRVVLAPEGIARQEAAEETDRIRLRRILNCHPGTRLCGFLGRLSPWKGATLFVEAVAAVMRDDPMLEAVILGGVDEAERDYQALLLAQIERTGLASHFHCVGELPPQDVAQWLRGLDVMLHTSLTPEPFGRVLIEAMAVGVPVISSAEGGPREIITSGVDGLLSEPPNDASALAMALSWALTEADRCVAMGREARRSVVARFHEEGCALPVLRQLWALCTK